MLCVGLFGVVMIGIVSASMVSRSKADETKEVMKNLNRSYSQAAQTISQMQTLRGQKQKIIDKKNRIEALQDPVPKSIVIAILTNARPDGVSLLHIKLDSRFDPPKKTAAQKLAAQTTQAQGKPAAPAPIPPQVEPNVTVDIIGLARTDFQVARYLANLTDSGLTEAVDLSYTQDYCPAAEGKEPPAQLQGLREFRLQCRLSKKIDSKDMARRWRLGKHDLSIEMDDKTKDNGSKKLIHNVSGTLK